MSRNKQSQVTVLVIEDEQIMRQSIIAYLEDSNFKVYSATDTNTAIRIYSSYKPDVVIADLQLGSIMGGLKILEQIHKLSPDIPIIIISGVGGMDEIITCLRSGAWDYLTKPINNMAILEHAICKALEKCRLLSESKLYAKMLKENLQELSDDQYAGRNVQMCLLPDKNYVYKNFKINYSINPSLHLSGDFLDYFIVDDKICLYLADVSGHGASSAFVTILLKSLIQRRFLNYEAHGVDTILKPNAIMAEVSKEIYVAKLGKYITMIYMVVNLDDGDCTYSVCGHYPNPILIEKNGEAKYLSGTGYPVGITKNVIYNTEAINIPNMGHLILMSDGIMELIENEKDMDMKDKVLLDSLVDSKGDINNFLNKHNIDSENKKLPDDISIISISRNDLT